MPLAALAWLRALVAGLLQGTGTKLLLLIQISKLGSISDMLRATNHAGVK